MDLRSILKSTKVGEVVLTHVPEVGLDATLAEAAEAMRKTRHGSALVCESGQLVGIVTERDILHVVGRGESLAQPVEGVMTRSPECTTADANLSDAIEAMDKGGYRRLPVVDGNRHVLGIVDVKTATHFLVQHFPSAVYNQASQTSLIARNREGA